MMRTKQRHHAPTWLACVAIGALAASMSSEAAARPRAKATRAPQGSESLFYDISENPGSLKLLALSDSGPEGAYTMIDVIDVSRSPKMMVGSKWRIDCAGERMTVVETTRVEPGSPPVQSAVQTETIRTRASPAAFKTAQLACTGDGDLVERRMHHGELIDIVKRFWAD